MNLKYFVFLEVPLVSLTTKAGEILSSVASALWDNNTILLIFMYFLQSKVWWFHYGLIKTMMVLIQGIRLFLRITVLKFWNNLLEFYLKIFPKPLKFPPLSLTIEADLKKLHDKIILKWSYIDMNLFICDFNSIKFKWFV